VADSLEQFGASARTVVSESIDGLFDDSIALPAVIEGAEVLLTELTEFDESLHQSEVDGNYRLGVVLDSIVRTVQYGVNVAEAGLRAEYREVN